MADLWSALTVMGYLLTLLLLPFALLQKKQHPIANLAWIMVIIILPYLGGLLFLVFGINRIERRLADKQAARLQIGPDLPGLMQYRLLPDDAPAPQLRQLMRVAEKVGNTYCCSGNSVEIIADTNRTLGLIEQAVLSAQHSIHLEYYIWQPDRTGRKLRDLLIQKAKQGVCVRFLFDGIGSLALGSRFLRPMREAGIKVAPFFSGSNFRERWSFNLRNHRKIVIVDGRVGFTGGMNIGDEYLGRNKDCGFWRDTHLRFEGPAVLQLQQVFAEDWFFTSQEKLTTAELFPRPETPGDCWTQVVAGGPDQDINVLESIFFAAINEARQRITLTTAYFVPTPALVTALQAAAYRGVHVRLLLQGKGAHPWMLLAARSYYETLIEAGVEICEYQKGLLHSKTLTVDGVWSLVGTGNFDARSLFLNFEVGLILYGTETAEKLERQFDADLKESQCVYPDRWPRRGIAERFGEQFFKLFSPVL